LQRSQFNILITSQAGLGYVAILVLLAILSTMGLAFIYKVGLMSSVTLNRRTSMQVHYLAESAANHALWNLLNNPEFAPESDKYYMHSLANGRYGYNVRMVEIIYEHQSGDAMVVWSRNGDSAFKYRMVFRG
jgi:hypothetical protein